MTGTFLFPVAHMKLSTTRRELERAVEMYLIPSLPVLILGQLTFSIAAPNPAELQDLGTPPYRVFQSLLTSCQLSTQHRAIEMTSTGH